MIGSAISRARMVISGVLCSIQSERWTRNLKCLPAESCVMSDDLEDASQREIRLRASAAGLLLWRNNSGVAQTVDRYGNTRPVRYGLANDSPAVNRVLKSSDLIGIAPDGRFVAIESKRPGWHFAGTDREQAQLAFI